MMTHVIERETGIPGAELCHRMTYERQRLTHRVKSYIIVPVDVITRRDKAASEV